MILQKTDKTTIENLISRNLMSRSYRKTESEIKKEKEEKSRLPDLEDEQQLDEIDEPEFEWDDTGVIPKATVQTEENTIRQKGYNPPYGHLFI